MFEVYVKAFPHPMILNEDGRLDLSPLRLQPSSISIHSILGLVGPDSITKRNWTSLLQILPKPAQGAAELGTEANPLQVDGTPVPGGCYCLICPLSSLKAACSGSPQEPTSSPSQQDSHGASAAVHAARIGMCALQQPTGAGTKHLACWCVLGLSYMMWDRCPGINGLLMDLRDEVRDMRHDIESSVLPPCLRIGLESCIEERYQL